MRLAGWVSLVLVRRGSNRGCAFDRRKEAQRPILDSARFSQAAQSGIGDFVEADGDIAYWVSRPFQ